jgi:ribose transport system substrate-binding protein
MNVKSRPIVASLLALSAAIYPAVILSSSAGASTKSDLAQAQTVVKAASAPLTKWTAPGPAVNAASVKGDTVAYIPDAPSIAYTEAVYAGFQQAAGIVGVKSLFLTNDSTPSGWEQNISEAISEKVSAIVLQGIPSGLIATGIKAANAANIPVIETSDEDISYPLQSGVAAQVQYPVITVGKVMAAYAIAHSTDGDVDAAVITSSDTSAAAPLLKGIRAEFKVACHTCKLIVDNVPVADWATKLPQLIPTVIQSNPKLNWIIPLYDSELPYITPAVTEAGAISRVHVVSFNATPGIMKDLADHDVLAADVGNPEGRFGFEMMDQAIRLITGSPALPTTKEYCPIRLFDTANFSKATFAKSQSSWYGSNAYVAGYTKLWEIS